MPGGLPGDETVDGPAVPPGARVAIRGFALTMIDAALALTEGRGGRFDGGSAAALAYGIRAVTLAGRDPAVLANRAADAGKDGPEWSRERDLERTARRRPSTASLACRRRSTFATTSCRHWAPSRSKRSLGWDPRATRQTALSAWLEAATGIEPPCAHLSPAAELARSVAIAAGTEPPDHQWALGHAWRATYPAIVARFGAEGLGPSSGRRSGAWRREWNGSPSGHRRSTPRSSRR